VKTERNQIKLCLELDVHSHIPLHTSGLIKHRHNFTFLPLSPLLFELKPSPLVSAYLLHTPIAKVYAQKSNNYVPHFEKPYIIIAGACVHLSSNPFETRKIVGIIHEMT
jgi:hypothetical protein